MTNNILLSTLRLIIFWSWIVTSIPRVHCKVEQQNYITFIYISHILDFINPVKWSCMLLFLKCRLSLQSLCPINVYHNYCVYHLKYSWLSLSRPRLSRITAYLEVKIWSLPKHENLTTGKKILWKRGEIAPKEQFLLFSTIFSIYL